LSHKKTKAHKSGNFKVIPPVNYYMIDKVAFDISDELFDVFTWDTVKTQTQTQWKVSLKGHPIIEGPHSCVFQAGVLSLFV